MNDDRPRYYPLHDRDPDDRHDPDAVLHVASMLYAAVLQSRPTMLDNVTATERKRIEIMRACVADAEAMTEIVFGLDDTPATLPVPPVVVPPAEGK